MARPTTIATEDIVEVARRLFLEHGPSLATSAIAREVGISEGSIFKRFPTKDALFLAAMGFPDCSFADAWPARAGEGEPRRELEAMGLALVAYFRKLLPRVVMAHSHPECGMMRLLGGGDEAPPRRIVGALTDYLAAERVLGRVRCEAPEVAARMLAGAFHNYVFFEVMGLMNPSDPDAAGHDGARAYAEAAVAQLWAGLAP